MAALLALYVGDTVKYFTPAAMTRFRSYSPMNLIVDRLARDAMSEGYRRVNVNGARKSQPDHHRFKRGFGRADNPYEHRVNRFIHKEKAGPAKQPTREMVEKGLHFFYVSPFDRLKELSLG